MSQLESEMDGELQICALCSRTLLSENEGIDLDSITLCGDCKFLLLEENGTSTPSQHIPRTNPNPRIIRRTRYNNNSSESIDDMLFQHHFSTMINLARQNPNPNPNLNPNVTSVSDTSARTTPSGSRRWRRGVSDTESDGFDSVIGDGDVVSYGAYDDDDDVSDVSVDVRSFLGGDSDTDIDPMNAGLNQWSSDDEWEAVDDGENGENGENTLGSLIARVHLERSMVYDDRSGEAEGGILVRISERRLGPFRDNDQETLLRYVRSDGDYLDARSFEELLERLAETDNSRRGAPPAARSFVNNLDRMVVNDSDHNGLVCAICKDLMTVGTVVNRLPCFHVYHPSCIKPWLSLHNTCPLCRFEFPTDDVDYENRKQSGNRGDGVQEIQQELDDDDDDDDNNNNNNNNNNNTSFEEGGGQEILNECGGGSSGGRRWWFAAAPVVSLVGIGLALWLGNTGGVKSSDLRGDRSRRLWGLF